MSVTSIARFAYASQGRRRKLPLVNDQGGIGVQQIADIFRCTCPFDEEQSDTGT